MDIGLESPVPPICFSHHRISRPLKFDPIDRSALTNTRSNPPQRRGRTGEVAGGEIFRKKEKVKRNVRGRSSGPPVPHHLEEFSIFRLRAEDLLKLD